MSAADYRVPVIDSAHPDFTYPAGRMPGCLPRASGFGKLFARASEKIKVVPRNNWDDYTGVSVRHFVKAILDQGSVGSCATEATTQAVMIARAFAGLPHVELNPWFIYHHTSDGVDRGSSIDANLEFVLKYGIAPVDVWPRSKGWRETPSPEAYAAALEFRDIEVYDIASIDEMVSGLLLPCPIVWGANGHAVCKVEHLDPDKGLDVNSWGDSWGDGGFGVWASYRAVNWSYGSFAVRAFRRSK